MMASQMESIEQRSKVAPNRSSDKKPQITAESPDVTNAAASIKDSNPTEMAIGQTKHAPC